MSTQVPPVLNFIDGRFVGSQQNRTSIVLNPATGKQITTAPDSTATDVDHAVLAARAAFEGWRAATPADRSTLLLKLADAVEKHRDELSVLE